MSELAFNANGDNFEVPAAVTGWRVRRMKPRGAPELVYGRDGRPLVVPISSDMDELRDAVGVLGRYRLDPVNDDGVVIEAVPAAYVQVFKPDRPPAPVEVVCDDGESVLREAMRLNTELAKSVIDRFPEMMQAAAELLRAADGAGLPARQPRLIEVRDEDDEDDEDDTASAVPAPIAAGASPFDLNAIVSQVVSTLMTSFMSGNLKLPGLSGLGALFDWRKATPANDGLQSSDASQASAEKATAKPSPKPAPAAKPAAMPPLDPSAMAHILAIQAVLDPKEVAFVQEVGKELSPAELRGWFDKLGKLSVPEAVTVIRDLIAGNGKTGGAS